MSTDLRPSRCSIALLLVSLMLPSSFGQRRPVIAPGDPAMQAMREYHALASRFVDSIDPQPGDIVVVFGMTAPDYLTALTAKVGPEGRVHAVFRHEGYYQDLKANRATRFDGRTVPIFAADGDAHLEPGQADLVIALDLYGFFLREMDLYRQARAALRPGGRLVQIKTAVRTQAEQRRFHPGVEGELQGRAGRLEQNRRLLQVAQFGFRFVREISLYNHRSVRVFEPVAIP